MDKKLDLDWLEDVLDFAKTHLEHLKEEPKMKSAMEYQLGYVDALRTVKVQLR